MKIKVHDESLTTHGIIVRTAGMDLTRFMAHSVLLFNHNYDAVLGKWTNVEVNGTEIFMEPEFDAEDPEAVKVENKLMKGFIDGASIGIEIGQYLLHEDDPDQAPEILTSELVEVSITPMPANTNARVVKFLRSGKEINFTNKKELQLSIQKADQDAFFIEEVKKENNKVVDDLKQILLQKETEILKLQVELKEDRRVSIMELESLLKTKQEENDKLNFILKQKDEELKSQKEKLKALKASFSEERINNFLNEAIKKHQITQSQFDIYKELALTNFDNVKNIINSMPVTNPKPLGTKFFIETRQDERKDWTFSEWSKKDSKGLLFMRTNEPDRYRELQEKEKKQYK